MSVKTIRKSVVVEEIDPEQAMEYLSKMPTNRSLSQGRVNQMARAMMVGDWHEDEGSPIRFDKEGNLLDGQHRLWAIVESKTTWMFHIKRGLDPEVLWVLDTGRPRSLIDMLKMRGEKYCGNLGGAISFLFAYENIGVLTTNRDLRPSVLEALTFLDMHPGLRESAGKAYPVRSAVGGGGARWTAIHYIFSGIDAEDCEDFFEKVATGEGLSKTDSIWHLRRKCVAVRSSLRVWTDMEFTALIIKAWNSYRAGRPVVSLRWTGGGARPEKYPKPE
jgi:hypothetical protein